MEFNGRYVISANPDTVWAALNDASVLAKSIPGAETVEKVSETEFTAAAQVRIGPVRARFQGRVTLIPHPAEPGFAHAATLKGEGQGGAAGFAKGESEIRLARDGGGTVLTYTAKANVGGRLAQIGQRLIDGAAKTIADEFFAKFAAHMATLSSVEEHPVAPVSVVPAGAESSPSKGEGLPPQIWVIGLIAVVLILLAVFSVVL